MLLHTTTVTALHMLVHMDKVTVLLANYDWCSCSNTVMKTSIYTRQPWLRYTCLFTWTKSAQTQLMKTSVYRGRFNQCTYYLSWSDRTL